jgi:hypothetical protein
MAMIGTTTRRLFHASRLFHAKSVHNKKTGSHNGLFFYR